MLGRCATFWGDFRKIFFLKKSSWNLIRHSRHIIHLQYFKYFIHIPAVCIQYPGTVHFHYPCYPHVLNIFSRLSPPFKCIFRIIHAFPYYSRVWNPLPGLSASLKYIILKYFIQIIRIKYIIHVFQTHYPVYPRH